ncbi:MAG: hypothetical protein Q8941_03990 [Bacteroidota bacterium]|nr:hypothetical protein [Bacteroidota bacterium]
MLLAIQFFSIDDFFLVPVCVILMYAILRSRAGACKDEQVRRLYFNAFYFKIICVITYTIITEFYFGGGDTSLYYQGVKDLRTALSDDANHFPVIITSAHLDDDNPLAPFFMYDNGADITYAYMRTSGNFFVPRLGLFPSLVFFNSYLCICLCFMMFALGGAIRLFKTFYYYYPTARREIALATLFLPSVGFWSSGLLKDTICFGAVGFMIYGIFTIFIRKKKIIASLFWIIVSGYLLYMIKTYIFLVLLLGITIWVFAETNNLIKDKTLRQIFALMTFIIAVAAGYLLLQYFTSTETLKQYQLDNIISSAESQRQAYKYLYEYGSTTLQQNYYTINASNPFLLIVNSIGATFFRPFPWEIKSAASVLSAIEALGFLFLTINLFMKKGLTKRFSTIFKDPRILFCFIFAVVFAVGVGASTANFGTLSRYKIPCMPFYMLMLLLTYRNTGLAYPKWLKRVLGLIK